MKENTKIYSSHEHQQDKSYLLGHITRDNEGK